MKKLEDRTWWPELVQLKDAFSLRELAARYDVAPAAISNALNRQGITRTSAPPGPRNKRPEEVQKRSQAALNGLKTEKAKTKTTALPEDSATKTGKAKITAPLPESWTTKASLPDGSTITLQQELEIGRQAPEVKRGQPVWEVGLDRPVLDKLFIAGELTDAAAQLSQEKVLSLTRAGTMY